jgi:hypothetical protein
MIGLLTEVLHRYSLIVKVVRPMHLVYVYNNEYAVTTWYVDTPFVQVDLLWRQQIGNRVQRNKESRRLCHDL